MKIRKVCGRSFVKIKNVEGRTDDFVRFPNGKYLHDRVVSSFVLIPFIKDIYFFQNEDYSLDILVVKEKNGDVNDIKNNISMRMRKIFEDKKYELKYKIIFKDYIKRKSSKCRRVETKVVAYK